MLKVRLCLRERKELEASPAGRDSFKRGHHPQSCRVARKDLCTETPRKIHAVRPQHGMRRKKTRRPSSGWKKRDDELDDHPPKNGQTNNTAEAHRRRPQIKFSAFLARANRLDLMGRFLSTSYSHRPSPIPLSCSCCSSCLCFSVESSLRELVRTRRHPFRDPRNLALHASLLHLGEWAKKLPLLKKEHVLVESLLKVEHFGKSWRTRSERRAPRRANSLSVVRREHLSNPPGYMDRTGATINSQSDPLLYLC